MITECDKNDAFWKLFVLNSNVDGHWQNWTVRKIGPIEVKQSKIDDQIDGIKRSELTVEKKLDNP